MIYNHAAQVLLRKLPTWRHNGAMALLAYHACTMEQWYYQACKYGGRDRGRKTTCSMQSRSPRTAPHPLCVFVVRVLLIIYIYAYVKKDLCAPVTCVPQPFGSKFNSLHASPPSPPPSLPNPPLHRSRRTHCRDLHPMTPGDLTVGLCIYMVAVVATLPLDILHYNWTKHSAQVLHLHPCRRLRLRALRCNGTMAPQALIHLPPFPCV